MSDFLLQLSARVAELESQVVQLRASQIQQTKFFKTELAESERKFMLRLNQLRNESSRKDCNR